MRDYDHKKHIGQIFGSLKCIAVGSTNKFKKKQLVVQCLLHSDESPFEVVKQSLLNGSTKGCPQCFKEIRQTHGKSGTKIYNAYKGIIGRVLDPTHKDYLNYGGRGIDIDPRYDPSFENQGLQSAFENFFGDIGDVPSGLTIDREDTNKGYWKDNIRFATIEEQQQNKRTNKTNPNMVRNINTDYATGKYSQADLVRKYNTTTFVVFSIVNGLCWSNIT